MLDVTNEGLVVREIANGFTLEEVKNSTEPDIIVSASIRYDAY